MQFDVVGFLSEIRDVAPGWGRMVLKVEGEQWQPFQTGRQQFRPAGVVEVLLPDGVGVPGIRQQVRVSVRIVPAESSTAAEEDFNGRGRYGQQQRGGSWFPRALLVASAVESVANVQPMKAAANK